MIGVFHLVKIIHTTRGQKKEGILFLYGQIANLGWDMNRWRWDEGYQCLNYNSNFGNDFVINTIPSTRAADKWQGYLPGNYWLYWSHMWDHARSSQETVFMWPIWHKA